jgi:hypothetical protein
MAKKFLITEIELGQPLPLEEGGEVVLERGVERSATPWNIQPVNIDAELAIRYGRMAGSVEESANTTWKSKILPCVATGIVVLITTVCACFLVALANDAFHGTLNAKDFIPMAGAFLKEVMPVLVAGVLLLNSRR